MQGTVTAGINSSSTIVGYFTGQDGNDHGFIRDADASFTVFDAPSPAAYIVPMSINDLGEIIGYFGDANGALYGFIRLASGIINAFDVPGAATSMELARSLIK